MAESKRRKLVLPVAFVGLTSAINAGVKIFTKIVSLFGSTYSEQLVAAHMDNGYTKFKGSSTVFKGTGLKYSRIPALIEHMARQIGVKNKDDIDKMSLMLRWSEYGDSDMWKQNQMTFSVGSGGMAKSFTLYANNDHTQGKMNILWMKTDAQFKLAPDVFVILVTKSRFGGLFTSSSVRFEKRPANIKPKDIQFVNEYFNLIAIQLVADLADLKVPKDPNFKKKRRQLGYHSNGIYYPDGAVTIQEYNNWSYDNDEEDKSSRRNGFWKNLLRPVLSKAKCWGCQQAKKWADQELCHKQCARTKGLESWCGAVCESALSCERLGLCPAVGTDVTGKRRLGYHSNGIYYPDGAVTIQEYNQWRL